MGIILKILGWFFGIQLALVAVGVIFIEGSFVFGMLSLLFSLLLIPNTREWFINNVTDRYSGKVLAFSGFAFSLFFSVFGMDLENVEPVDTPVAQVETVKEEQEVQPLAVVPAPVEVEEADNICKVVGITDGDTFTCLTSNKEQIKVRMNQIDAPEKGQDFGNASKKYLSELIVGKEIRLEKGEIDKYGRTIGDVYVDDVYINEKMVKDGYAWAYRRYTKDDSLLKLEEQARLDMKGLWSQPNPIYPSEFRNPDRERIVTNEVNPSNEVLPLVSEVKTAEPQKINEAPQVAHQKTEIKPAPKPTNACGSKRYCTQMSSCKEARFYLNQCGLSRLDRDNDGIPCESLCR